jgi:hypothetical protein
VTPLRTRPLLRLVSTVLWAPLIAAAGCSNGPFILSPAERAQVFAAESLAGAATLTGAVREPAPAVTHGGLRYGASVTRHAGTPATGPLSLWIVVDVTNPGGSAVSLPVLGCTVRPEFRPAGAEVPVWSPLTDGCAQAPYVVELAAGATHRFTFLAYDAMLLSIEDGRYDLTARVHLPDTVLRLDAGTADVLLGLPNVAYHVTVSDDGGRPSARVRVENLNAEPLALAWGACAVGFELHRRADLSDEPVRLGQDRTCERYLASGSVAPGAIFDAREFEYTLRGDRSPGVGPGRYELVVTFRLNWRTYRFPMGPIMLR